MLLLADFPNASHATSERYLPHNDAIFKAMTPLWTTADDSPGMQFP
jgi:hypothetical protein